MEKVIINAINVGIKNDKLYLCQTLTTKLIMTVNLRVKTYFST